MPVTWTSALITRGSSVTPSPPRGSEAASKIRSNTYILGTASAATEMGNSSSASPLATTVSGPGDSTVSPRGRSPYQ